MKKNLLFHNPEGFRDIYGHQMKEKMELMDSVRGVFARRGYEMIETPTVEYFDVFSKDVGTTPSNELYKFFDRDGNTLVLRPDFTPSVARAVAMHMKPDEVYRLCYEGSTFVNSKEYQLNLKESAQMGVELIGDGSVEADAEVISLCCDLLKSAGFDEFQVSVGEVDYFKALSDLSGLDSEVIEEARQMISVKNDFGLEELLDDYDLAPDVMKAFVRLPKLFGNRSVLDEAAELSVCDGMKKAVDRLISIDSLIEGTDNAKYISYDLGALSRYAYYTGIVFSAFTYGSGEPVAKGGRYDRLLTHFGTDSPAVGVGVYIDQLLAVRSRRRIV